MLKRPTELQCYDIIKWSVQYLQGKLKYFVVTELANSNCRLINFTQTDYGMHENALFRESKSQHDIRSLKAQICEGTFLNTKT